jgi:hypothetical protein
MANGPTISTAEKAAILYRNFNTVVALGAVAIGALTGGVIAAAAYTYAGFNGVQAGLGEAARRVAAKNRKS